MQCFIQQLFEDGGRAVPRWRESVRPITAGDLELSVEYIADFKNSFRVARLHQEQAGARELFLIDAAVMFVSGELWTVRGFEYDAISRKFTRQAWCVKLSAAPAARLATSAELVMEAGRRNCGAARILDGNFHFNAGSASLMRRPSEKSERLQDAVITEIAGTMIEVHGVEFCESTGQLCKQIWRLAVKENAQVKDLGVLVTAWR